MNHYHEVNDQLLQKLWTAYAQRFVPEVENLPLYEELPVYEILPEYEDINYLEAMLKYKVKCTPHDDSPSLTLNAHVVGYDEAFVAHQNKIADTRRY